jgi:hypothetical protein
MSNNEMPEYMLVSKHGNDYYGAPTPNANKFHSNDVPVDTYVRVDVAAAEAAELDKAKRQAEYWKGKWMNAVGHGKLTNSDPQGVIEYTPPPVPTLRDQFAMAALPSIMRAVWGFAQDDANDRCAKLAYAVADAMFAARGQKGGP